MLVITTWSRIQHKEQKKQARIINMDEVPKHSLTTLLAINTTQRTRQVSSLTRKRCCFGWRDSWPAPTCFRFWTQRGEVPVFLTSFPAFAGDIDPVKKFRNVESSWERDFFKHFLYDFLFSPGPAFEKLGFVLKCNDVKYCCLIIKILLRFFFFYNLTLGKTRERKTATGR